ncbi:oligosaccharide flippase family protein [Xenorhabdus bovienii]|uniref:oligosaccharide flippase family protein n=1 Tax=Xenorhabdus bovienii TaxID=40576 RepID=UPI000570E034|nr:oligosaccharide flippase family protein [Xenorhabdus bovienii]
MSNKREVINNIISLSSINVLGIIIPIITMPILSRALGSELYGQYLLLITILIFGHTIIDYAVQYVGVRDVSKSRENYNKIRKYYIEYQSLRLLLCSIYTFVVLVYSYLFLSENMFKWLIFSGIPYLVGYVLSSFWFYQSLAETKFLAYANILSRVISLLVIILAVQEPDDINLVVISSTWPIFISGIILFLRIKKEYKINIFFCRKNLFSNIKNGYAVFIGTLAPNLYNSIPTIILGSISSPSEFAKFAIASRICGIITTFQDILSRSFFPVLTRNKKNYLNKILIINSLLSIPLVILLLFFGENILLIFLGKQYENNIYLEILSIGIIFIGIINTYSDGYFLPKGYDRIYKNISIRISLISALIAYILIYNYSLLGGAIAITLARILFSFDYYLSYKKISKNP